MVLFRASEPRKITPARGAADGDVLRPPAHSRITPDAGERNSFPLLPSRICFRLRGGKATICSGKASGNTKSSCHQSQQRCAATAGRKVPLFVRVPQEKQSEERVQVFVSVGQQQEALTRRLSPLGPSPCQPPRPPQTPRHPFPPPHRPPRRSPTGFRTAASPTS